MEENMKEKVESQIIRRYEIPREEFMELWIKALSEGHMGEWLLAECKKAFDGDQPVIGGKKPELTWAKVKARMNYYRRQWDLTGVVEALPFKSGKNIQDKVEFERAWKQKLLTANEGAEQKRRDRESKA